MARLMFFALLILLQQGGAANVKNLPEIVHHETAVNEVEGQCTVYCPSQPTPSCPALDHLLLYLNAQLSLEGQVEQLKNRTDSLDGQVQQLAQQELAELQVENDLKATVEALQATVSSQDNIIQQQAGRNSAATGSHHPTARNNLTAMCHRFAATGRQGNRSTNLQGASQ